MQHQVAAKDDKVDQTYLSCNHLHPHTSSSQENMQAKGSTDLTSNLLHLCSAGSVISRKTCCTHTLVHHLHCSICVKCSHRLLLHGTGPHSNTLVVMNTQSTAKAWQSFAKQAKGPEHQTRAHLRLQATNRPGALLSPKQGHSATIKPQVHLTNRAALHALLSKLPRPTPKT